MLNDQRTPYRWQDHVIAPQRTALNLLATVLIVAVVSVAGLAYRDPPAVARVPATSERTPSLAQSVKRPPAQHHIERFDGC
jgi:hypothetical protein